MSFNPSDAVPENQLVREPPQAEPTTTHPEVQGRLDRARWWLILGGLAAGLLAFAIGEATYELIPPKIVPINMMGHTTMGPSPETSERASVRNAAIAFGVFGVCLGGLLGIAGGLARRSVSASVTAGLLGSVLGMVPAVGGSLMLLPYFLKVIRNNPDYDLILSMIMHGLIWCLIGAAAGLAFAVGLGERRLIGRSLVAGIAGAALGVVAFDLIGAIVFPLADTGLPISVTRTTRFLARIVVAIATAGILILSLPGCAQPGQALIRDRPRAACFPSLSWKPSAGAQDSHVDGEYPIR